MKWKLSFFLLFSFTLLAYSQQSDEAAKIISLLEKESATWRSGDGKGHADCWHIQPYSRILISTGNGTALDITPAAMKNTDPATMGNGGFSVNTNYKISIQKNSAWVSHDELSTSKEGTKSYSYEIRLLEKIKGEWKLVGQSIHIYKPE